MEEIDSIIKKIETESFVRIREKAKREYGISHDDIRLISSTITAISIDGKSYTNPLGTSGANIRLTILNVFAPASDYNMVRSIVSSLDKRVISLIPMPLVFPKLIEKSDYMGQNTCTIDIGYSHTTFALEAKNEIIAFETFPVGMRSLIELLSIRYPECSGLQIEQMLHTTHLTGDVDAEYDEFLEYIFDALFGFLEQNFEHRILANILSHGGIFQNHTLKEHFLKNFESRYGHSLRHIDYHTIDPALSDADSAIPY